MEGNGKVSKNSRKRKTADGVESKEPKDAKPTHQMILKWHDVWTQVTMSGFFDEVQKQAVSDEQLEEWIRFRHLLASRLVSACARLKKSGMDLPCAEAVEEDSIWLTKYAKDMGIDTSLHSSRLLQLTDIAKYIDSITIMDADTTGAGIGVWATLLSCFQGWNLSLERGKLQMDDNFAAIGTFLARESKIQPILETESMLDAKVSMDNMKACEDVFCGSLQRISEFYEELLFQGWTEDALRCKKCGRFGHIDAKCLFKAKASRAN